MFCAELSNKVCIDPMIANILQNSGATIVNVGAILGLVWTADGTLINT